MEPDDLCLPVFEAGSVWLVAAGPGDPGLLTLHAVNGLPQADAVVYDALVSSDTLDFPRPDCEGNYAPKPGVNPSPVQHGITQRQSRLPQAAQRVLSLICRAPFLFGTGEQNSVV